MEPLIDQSDSLEVILKITERCNINCTYCYMFNKGNDDYLSRPAKIDSEWIDDVLRFLVEGVAALRVNRVNVVFHGGEPLMLKKSKFREICLKLRSGLGEVVELNLGMQTNAMLIDDEWIEIISEFKVGLGISLDGPPAIHDRFRLDKRGRGTHAGTMRGMALLQDAYNQGRVSKPGIICVINPEHSAREIYRYIVDDLQIDTVSFNLPIETNDTISPSYEEGCGRYLTELFEEWTADDNPQINIRLFDNMLRFFSGDKEFQALLPNFITKHVMVVIASDGTLSEHDDFKVINFAQRGGTIRDTSLYEFANSPLRRYLDLVTQTIPDGCQSCEWRGYCRAGVTHGLTVSRYSRANGFDNRSSLCGAFASLFEAGAGYLMRNGLPANRLRDALETEGLGTAAVTPTLKSVPQELFS